MCYFTPFDFDVLGTCHEVASFFVSFVDLSEVTSQKEQQMTRRRRLPRGMYLVNNAIINALCNVFFYDLMLCSMYVLMYVLMCYLMYVLMHLLMYSLMYVLMYVFLYFLFCFDIAGGVEGLASVSVSH